MSEKIEFGADGDEFIILDDDDNLTVVTKCDVDGNVSHDPADWKELQIRVDNVCLYNLAMAILSNLDLKDHRGPF
jgi:hypothetical protein